MPVNQDVPESVPGPRTSSQVSEDGYGYDADDLEAVAGLRDRSPVFCRVELCLYWHTDSKQVRRHRNSHFPGRLGYLYPNKTSTCTGQGHGFKRRDAVKVHCRRSTECGRALLANNGRILQWGGELVNEYDFDWTASEVIPEAEKWTRDEDDRTVILFYTPV